jgi:hypothetical protein
MRVLPGIFPLPPSFPLQAPEPVYQGGFYWKCIVSAEWSAKIKRWIIVLERFSLVGQPYFILRSSLRDVEELVIVGKLGQVVGGHA